LTSEKKLLEALDLLTMGKIDVRSWWSKVGRETHARLMMLKYIETVPNKNGSTWYAQITNKGKEKIEQ
tara:strand:- start:1917 stop:2120 length:204 start_codon:yes stop_codon:yes gene_type:complete